MIEYYIYFIIVWGLAFFELLTKRNMLLITLIFFFLFVSLRVDTGYDWPVYKEMFYSLVNIQHYSGLLDISTMYHQEIGFVFFAYILQNLSSDFQILIIAIAFIETYALYRFLRLTSKSPTIVIATASTWLLFTLYFSVLRQGLAVSFFLLFMISSFHKKYIKSILLLLFSLSVQISSAMYFILYFLSSYKIKKEFLGIFFLVSLLLGFFSQTIALTIFSIIETLGIPVLSSKMSWYVDGRITSVNTFDRIYVYVYSITMFLFLYKTWHTYNDKIMIRLSFFAIIFIFIQLILIEYPLIRNRLQYVSFMMQFILIVNYLYDKKINFRFIATLILMFIVLLYYSLMLFKSYAVVFVPYQDYIRYNILDYRSTGKERQSEMFNIQYQQK